MNRKETTKFLSNLLISDRLTGMGTYYAREVSVDYGTSKGKRIDFLQFEPAGVTSIGDIEKGIFTCYEIKSCKRDVYSGNGLNFIGEKNYIVTTMECYKELIEDINNGKLLKHIRKTNPDSQLHYGVMVPVPWGSSITEEFEHPKELTNDITWELKVILACRQGRRTRSMQELLFYMVRSGR